MKTKRSGLIMVISLNMMVAMMVSPMDALAEEAADATVLDDATWERLSRLVDLLATNISAEVKHYYLSELRSINASLLEKGLMRIIAERKGVREPFTGYEYKDEELGNRKEVAVFLLGEMRARRAVPLLLNLLRSEDPTIGVLIRQLCIDAIGKTRETSAIPILLEILEATEEILSLIEKASWEVVEGIDDEEFRTLVGKAMREEIHWHELEDYIQVKLGIDNPWMYLDELFRRVSDLVQRFSEERGVLYGWDQNSTRFALLVALARLKHEKTREALNATMRKTSVPTTKFEIRLDPKNPNVKAFGAQSAIFLWYRDNEIIEKIAALLAIEREEMLKNPDTIDIIKEVVKRRDNIYVTATAFQVAREIKDEELLREACRFLSEDIWNQLDIVDRKETLSYDDMFRYLPPVDLLVRWWEDPEKVIVRDDYSRDVIAYEVNHDKLLLDKALSYLRLHGGQKEAETLATMLLDQTSKEERDGQYCWDWEFEKLGYSRYDQILQTIESISANVALKTYRELFSREGNRFRHYAALRLLELDEEIDVDKALTVLLKTLPHRYVRADEEGYVEFSSLALGEKIRKALCENIAARLMEHENLRENEKLYMLGILWAQDRDLYDRLGWKIFKESKPEITYLFSRVAATSSEELLREIVREAAEQCEERTWLIRRLALWTTSPEIALDEVLKCFQKEEDALRKVILCDVAADLWRKGGKKPLKEEVWQEIEKFVCETAANPPAGYEGPNLDADWVERKKFKIPAHKDLEIERDGYIWQTATILLGKWNLKRYEETLRKKWDEKDRRTLPILAALGWLIDWKEFEAIVRKGIEENWDCKWVPKPPPDEDSDPIGIEPPDEETMRKAEAKKGYYWALGKVAHPESTKMLVQYYSKEYAPLQDVMGGYFMYNVSADDYELFALVDRVVFWRSLDFDGNVCYITTHGLSPASRESWQMFIVSRKVFIEER